MVSAHSNIHRLRPRLRLVIDNADRKPSVDPTIVAGGSSVRAPDDDPTPHPVGA